MAKYCGKCGSPLDANTGLCPNCDQVNTQPPQQLFNEQPAPQPVQQARQPHAEPDKPKKPAMPKVKKIVRIVEICLIIALVITIALTSTLWVLAANKHKDVKHNDVSSSDSSDDDDSYEPTPPKEKENSVYTPDDDSIVYDKSLGKAYVNNIILVFFEPGVTDDEVDEVVTALNGEVVGKLETIDQYQVKVAASSFDELNDLCKKAKSFPRVTEAMIDRAVPLSEDYVPDDPWGDSVTWSTDKPEGNNWWATAINAPDGWYYYDSAEAVPVGIVDNGCDTAHPELKNITYTTDNNDAAEHGTHVAGIAAAEGNNEEGICGVSYKSELVTADWQLTSAQEELDIPEYKNWSTDSQILGDTVILVEKGAKVINYSLGKTANLKNDSFGSSFVDEEGKVASQYLCALLDRSYDFVIVQSAGNGNASQISVDAVNNGLFCSVNEDNCVTSDKVSYSDIRDRILVVGAAYYDSKDDKYIQASWSNAGDRVDVCAPGVNVYSLAPGNSYQSMSGTSMAAPVVTGVAAMTWSINHNLTGAEVKEIVCNTTREYVDTNPDKKAHPLTNTYYLVDAGRAAERAYDSIDDSGSSKRTYDGDPIHSKRDVVLVLDTSGSMEGDPIEQTRNAADKFVDSVIGNNVSVGIVTYSDDAEKVCNFTNDSDILKPVIDGIDAYGMTNIYDGLQTAESMLDESTAQKKIIVLMSDGMPNEGLVGPELIDYADGLKDKGFYIYTLGFFEELGSDKYDAQQLMEKLASDGCHYEVANSDDLIYFFGDIGDMISGTRFIYVRIACPVDVKVSCDGETLDSSDEDLNTRTSFGSLTFEEAEKTEEDYYSSDSTDDAPDKVKILRLKDGEDYDIKIKGTGSGHMDYRIGLMDSNGEYSDFRDFNNIRITKSTKIDTVAANTDKTVMKVDEDGDGKYDHIYEATANGKAVLVDYSVYKTIVIVCSIVLGSIILLHILIVLIIKFIKKRPKRTPAPAAASYGAQPTNNNYSADYRCPTCGAPIHPGDAACSNCGTPIQW